MACSAASTPRGRWVGDRRQRIFPQEGADGERVVNRRRRPQGDVRGLAVPEQPRGALGPVVRRLPGRLVEEGAEPLDMRRVELALGTSQREDLAIGRLTT